MASGCPKCAASLSGATLGTGRGRLREALQQAEEAESETGRRHSLEGLAATLTGAGRLDIADSLHCVLLDLQRHRLDIDSLAGLVVVRTLGSLGEINLSHGRVDRADSLSPGSWICTTAVTSIWTAGRPDSTIG